MREKGIRTCQRTTSERIHAYIRLYVYVCVLRQRRMYVRCINDGGWFVAKFSKIFSMRRKAKVNNKNEHKQASSDAGSDALTRGRRIKFLMKEIEASRLKGCDCGSNNSSNRSIGCSNNNQQQ